MTHPLPISRRTLLQNSLLGAAAFGVPAILARCSNPADQSTPGAGGSARGARSPGLQLLRRGAQEGVRRPLEAFDPGRTSRSTRSTTTRSRRTSPATCRARRTTCSPGSPATGCGSSPRRAWPRRSTTSGTTIGANYSDALQEARPPATTARSTSCRSTTTRGRSSTARALWQAKGYQVPKTIDELTTLATQDEDGRPGPRSGSPTRTAGRRWAPSTSSTCGSTATTSTST